MNIVRVYWVDSHCPGSYWHYEAPDDPAWCTSVGYLVPQEGECNYLTLAQGYGQNANSRNGLIQIPMASIQFIEEFPIC